MQKFSPPKRNKDDEDVDEVELLQKLLVQGQNEKRRSFLSLQRYMEGNPSPTKTAVGSGVWARTTDERGSAFSGNISIF